MTVGGRNLVWLAGILLVGTMAGWQVFDVGEYVRYAHLALRAPLFSRWPREYPPASLLVMLPGLFGRLGFMVGTMTASVLVYARLERKDVRWATRWLVLVTLGGLLTVVARYDMWPTLALLLAVEAGQRRAWRAAWWWALIAALLKLFGLVLMPVLLAAEWRSTGRLRWDRAVWAAGVFGASWLVPWWIEGPRALSSLAWFLHRPIEVESVAAPILRALGGHLAYVYLSVSVVSRWDNLAGIVLAAVFVGALTFIVRGVAQGRLTLEAGAALAITWLVLTGKVLSAQYLLWLFPLWVLAWPEELPWLAYAAAALTTGVYPVAALLFRHGLGYWVVDSLKGAALAAFAIVGWRQATRGLDHTRGGLTGEATHAVSP